MINDLKKYRKELLTDNDAKKVRKIYATMDAGDLSLKGEAGSGMAPEYAELYGDFSVGMLGEFGLTISASGVKVANVIISGENVFSKSEVIAGSGIGNLGKTVKSATKEAKLPNKGKIRYVPPENWTPTQPLPKNNGGYIDKFGNVWTKGPSRTAGQSFEWDVQLSKTGKNQMGWLSRDGSHLNVSLDGEITHK